MPSVSSCSAGRWIAISVAGDALHDVVSAGSQRAGN